MNHQNYNLRNKVQKEVESSTITSSSSNNKNDYDDEEYRRIRYHCGKFACAIQTCIANNRSNPKMIDPVSKCRIYYDAYEECVQKNRKTSSKQHQATSTDSHSN